MGMNQLVHFSDGQLPSWPALRDLLTAHKFPFQMRMIDGELAFPDEEPADSWRELRLATQDGQAITVRRNADQVELVVWGNADQTLVQAWNALTWAFAECGQGSIETAQGKKTASEYWMVAELPDALRGSSPNAGSDALPS